MGKCPLKGESKAGGLIYLKKILQSSSMLQNYFVLSFFKTQPGISDFQCVGSFPGFLQTLQLNLFLKLKHIMSSGLIQCFPSFQETSWWL